ncbi:hypothetical protein BDV29DRAFT_172682 [Aspergillus leporis]|uniref:Uncharacterized protein n=1 Tax=Aspergillus leporis TaxID=41062 RepID=A0A5N5X4E2_9EURO|nr:hypothetical protein BDV29DRAFT_172682 [Aspergillus leporis]
MHCALGKGPHSPLSLSLPFPLAFASFYISVLLFSQGCDSVHHLIEHELRTGIPITC